MLELIRMKNLALIPELELEFSPGLNVLTGESGAGKSFILKGLDFLLGNRRASTLQPWDPGRKVMVEALFSVAGKEIIIRREFNPQGGRSRIFIDDRLSSQEKIRALRPRLLLHSSQHAQQQLLSPMFFEQVLVSLIDPKLVDRRATLVSQLQEVLGRQKEVLEQGEKLAAQRDFLEYQKKEIEQVAPLPGEEEELESRRRSLKEAAQRHAYLQKALELLRAQQGLLEQFGELSAAVQSLAALDGEFCADSAQLDEIGYFLQELQGRLAGAQRDVDQQAELNQIEARLWALSQLKRKLNRPLASILTLHDELRANLDFLDNCQLELRRLARLEEDLRRQLGQVLQAMDREKQDQARSLADKLEQELVELGFPKGVRVQFTFNVKEILPGLEELFPVLSWCPNPGQPLLPLDQIASGGELSRFLLALISIFSLDNLPTLIFDEVDAGIGGLVLQQVGQKVRSLAARQQVLLITHWPQLACLADRHFRVYKEVVSGKTVTCCAELSPEEQERELARMAGGGKEAKLLAEQLVAKG